MYGEYTNMYLVEAMKTLRKITSRPKVLHQQTCFDCGRKLVNTYYSDKEKRYMCKQCLDKGGNNNGIR